MITQHLPVPAGTAKNQKPPAGPSRPLSEKQLAARPKRAAPDHATLKKLIDRAALGEPLSDADREEAVEIVRRSKPSLCAIVAPKKLVDAIVVLRDRLFDVERWSSHPRIGEPHVTATGAGLAVTAAGGRKGVIDWVDVASELIDDGDETALDSNAPPKGVRLEAGGERPEGLATREAEKTRRRNARVNRIATAHSEPSENSVAKPPANVPPGTATCSLQPPASSPPVLIEIAIAAVRVSKDNPRQTFDGEALAELADSIRAHGVIEPLIVFAGPEDRPAAADKRSAAAGGGQAGHPAQQYELIAGERRLRAAKLAGLERVPCCVREVGPAQAAEMRLIENLLREDLTAIEEAHGFQALIKRFGHTHEALAQKIGKSQGHVTNRLRLLKLPAKWQARIISREIPPTHGRALIAYAERPELLKAIDGFCFRHDGPPASFKQFEKDVDEAVERATEPMSGTVYAWRLHRSVQVFYPTEEERAELRVIEVRGKDRATNTKLWRKLQDAHEIKLAAADGKKAGGKRRETTGAGTPAKQTPAQEKAKAKKAAGELARWIKDWRSDWLRSILAVRVTLDERLALRAVVMGLAHGHSVQYAAGVVERAMGKIGLAAIAGDREPAETLAGVAAHWLWNKAQAEASTRTMPAGAVEALAAAAGVKLEEAWTRYLAGDLTEAFFNRHTSAGCAALAREMGIDVEGATKKSELVETILHVLDRDRTKRKLPRSIARVATTKVTTKGTRKKGARS